MAASLGFFIGIGNENIPWSAVGALLVGGLIAAPIAAYLVRHVPARMLGASVGGIIILTNTRTLLNAFDVSNSLRPASTSPLRSIWAGFLGLALQGLVKDRREERLERERERSSSPPPEVDHVGVINPCQQRPVHHCRAVLTTRA